MDFGMRKKALYLAFVSCVCVLIISVWGFLIREYVYDLDLVFPLIKNWNSPGLYPQEDLLIQSSKPFHFYYLMSKIVNESNIDFFWYVGYLLVSFFGFCAYWVLSFSIVKKVEVATISTLLLALMHPFRGSLNWSWSPMPSLLSAWVAMPFSLIGFSCLIAKKYLFIVPLCVIISFLHPGQCLILSFSLLVCITFEKSISKAIRVLMIGCIGIVVSPNLIFLIGNVASGNKDFFQIFEMHAYHAFFRDHWQEGYVWFGCLLTMGFILTKLLKKEVRVRLRVIFYALLLLLTVYIFNLYSLKNPALCLSFLFRVTIFLKPMLISLLINYFFEKRIFFKFLDQKFWITVLETTLFLGACFVDNIKIAEVLMMAFMLIFLCTKLNEKWMKRIFSFLFFGGACVLLIKVLGYRFGEFLFTFVVGSMSLCMFILLTYPYFIRTEKDIPISNLNHSITFRFVFFAGTLALVSASVMNYFRCGMKNFPFGNGGKNISSMIKISMPPKNLENLYCWFNKINNTNLVLVPPLDSGFSRFRLVTNKGVFIHLGDINQIAYSQKNYFEAHQRLIKIGVKTIGPHQFDDSDYYNMSPAYLAELANKENIDFGIFENSKINFELKSIPYETDVDGFRVFSLKNLKVVY